MAAMDIVMFYKQTLQLVQFLSFVNIKSTYYVQVYEANTKKHTITFHAKN